MIATSTQTLSSQLSSMGVQAARGNPEKEALLCGIKELDDFFEGGLPIGSLVEWGAPLGRGGREAILPWIRAATQDSWVLWSCGRSHLNIYPPAWQARGIHMERIRFAQTRSPLAELKPVFMDPFFRVIVLDSLRTSSKISGEDCAFMARQARVHNQMILLLRDFILSPKRGNVWAKLRLNCWQDPTTQQLRLHVIRGLSPRQLSIDLTEVRYSPLIN